MLPIDPFWFSNCYNASKPNDVYTFHTYANTKKKEEKENLHQSFQRKREMGGTIEITSYIYYSSDRLQSADLV